MTARLVASGTHGGAAAQTATGPPTGASKRKLAEMAELPPPPLDARGAAGGELLFENSAVQVW